MCVGLPAKVAEIKDGMAVVDASGFIRTVSADVVEILVPGVYVMVHAGVAIAWIGSDDAEEADQVMALIN